MVGRIQTINQNPYPAGGQPKNWRTIMPTLIQHNTQCCEGPEPHVTLFSLGIQSRQRESPGNLTLRASGIWLQKPRLHSWRPKPKSCMYENPEERTSDATGDWIRPTCSVGGSYVRARVGSGLPQGHWQEQFWEVPLGVSPLGGHHWIYHKVHRLQSWLASGQTNNRKGEQSHPLAVCCLLSCFSHIQLFATVWTLAHEALLSMGFSRQEYSGYSKWVARPFSSRKSSSLRDRTFVSYVTLHWQAGSLPLAPAGKPTHHW